MRVRQPALPRRGPSAFRLRALPDADALPARAPCSAQFCEADDWRSPELQQRYGTHWLPSILAHMTPDAPPPVAFAQATDSKRPARAGLCGIAEIAKHYCPLF
jgi:hypothetical protein